MLGNFACFFSAADYFQNPLFQNMDYIYGQLIFNINAVFYTDNLFIFTKLVKCIPEL